MKVKYNGILALCFFLGSIFITAIYAMHFSEAKYEFKLDRKQNSLADVYVPSSVVLKKIEILQRDIPEIAKQQKPDTAPVNLGLFGYHPVSYSKSNDLPGTKNKRFRSLEADYKLTLAFSAEKNSFCIINDTLYSPGDMLPGGARVAKIESKRVMIQKLGSDTWIELIKKSEQLEKQK